MMKFYIVVVHYLRMSMKEENEGPEYFERDKLVFGVGEYPFCNLPHSSSYSCSK